MPNVTFRVFFKSADTVAIPGDLAACDLDRPGQLCQQLGFPSPHDRAAPGQLCLALTNVSVNKQMSTYSMNISGIKR